ncbi:hypothetical protein LOC72_26625 [Roseiconus lacunae]|nr:hypothetical protein [Roseiconus lacunae]
MQIRIVARAMTTSRLPEFVTETFMQARPFPSDTSEVAIDSGSTFSAFNSSKRLSSLNRLIPQTILSVLSLNFHILSAESVSHSLLSSMTASDSHAFNISGWSIIWNEFLSDRS